MYKVDLSEVEAAAKRLENVALCSPLGLNETQSRKYGASVYFKREDLQQVRSYKIRGAYNKISTIPSADLQKGVVCASAGNHAQGVAYSCARKKVKGMIFMPTPTPKQKIAQVKMFGGDYVEVILVGDTFDDASQQARDYCKANAMIFVHPFDDEKVIEGQATIGLEILAQSKVGIDYLFLPVGGGGVASGVSSVFKALSPKTKIIGVEPEGAPSMSTSLANGVNTTLDEVEKFVDGASVKRVGDLNFHICKKNLNQMATVHEGKICQTILDMYNQDAIVVEPAGAMTVAALDDYSEEIRGKNVVCLVSGSNNDITRTEEIKERALLHAGVKHYFVVRFPQRAGALRDFIDKVLGPNDDITHFEYSKKQSRENAPAVVGIELGSSGELNALIERMKAFKFYGEYLNDKPDLFQFLV
ncbi:MAG: threonine ammonia-lyase [Crocinitomicaceae bacterium]|jgi:threonine dehydratase|nr:threonine ammonia-lyase [Crocinitomicaceae bacterium]